MGGEAKKESTSHDQKRSKGEGRGKPGASGRVARWANVVSIRGSKRGRKKRELRSLGGEGREEHEMGKREAGWHANMRVCV